MTIRVHELAKELKISTMALKKHLTDLGVNVKSHMSLIEDEVADKIRKKYKEQVDAEKQAERDRKRLIEMRQAAKAQKTTQEVETKKKEEIVPPVPEKVEEVPKKEEPKPVKEPEKKTVKPVTEKPIEEKPKETIKEKPSKPTPEKPKIAPPKTATPAKPEYRKKQEPTAPAKKTVLTPPPPEIKKEEKKFGKTKISHEELGEKSKHKKAIISSSKKAKQKLIETIEIDEAEISRNIKKTLQKSSKRKKYQRVAQYVEDHSDEIVIREFTSVSELAKIMNVSPSDIISKFFMMGQLVTMNQRLDRDSLEMICDEFKVDYRFEDEYGMDIIDKEREQYTNVEENLVLLW